jgi:hypothetical protein
MEPECLLLLSQVPATCLYPVQSIPPHPTSWRSILILSSHLRLDLPICLFPLGFPTKTLYKPLPSPSALHAPPIIIIIIIIILILVLHEDNNNHYWY